MSALSDLFQDIADAIRTKTGDTAAMAPLAFPDNILSIEGGSGGGPAIKVAKGQFRVSEDEVNGVTIAHNLGIAPDLVIVRYDGLDTLSDYAVDDSVYSAMFYAISYSQAAKSAYGVNDASLNFYSNASLASFGFDLIDFGTESFAVTDDVNMHPGTYSWVAIANLTTATGGVTLENAEEVSF